MSTSPITIHVSQPGANLQPEGQVLGTLEAIAEPRKRVSAFDLVASQPWAITPDMLETIAAIARGEGEGVEALEARLGRPLQNARTVTVRDGVAVVPVTGPIFRYANLFTEISGATSLEVLAKDFTSALDDPNVKAVVLAMDSPGGQANGIAEFAQMVRAASKPVVAYVDGSAASAAYWIAAAADKVVMSKTGMVGSVGAVFSASVVKDKNTVEIVSSQSPNKRPDVMTEPGRAQMQALIDSLAQVFIEDVAAYRNTDTQTVLTSFGQGAMFIAADAVKRGMADEVSTLEAVIAGLSGKTTKGASMSASAGTPAPEKPAIDRAYLAANHPELLTALHAEGATAERARILGIQALAIPGHEALVAALVEDGHTTAAEAAVQILQAEKKANKTRADNMAADAPAPAPFAAAPEGGAGEPAAEASIEERAQSAWDKDADLRAEFGGAFASYLSYRKAEEAGRVKTLSK